MSFTACGEARDMEFVTTGFRVAVLPLEKELEAALFYQLDRKRCCVRQLFSPLFQRRQILPGLCRTDEADKGRRAQTETKG